MASKKSAARSSETNSNNDDDSGRLEDDDELDFFSSNFNPRRALLASSVNVPFKSIKTFTSVESYEEAVRRQTKKPAQQSTSTDGQHASSSSGCPTKIKAREESPHSLNTQMVAPTFRFGEGNDRFREHKQKSIEKNQTSRMLVESGTTSSKSKEEKEELTLSRERKYGMNLSGSKPKRGSKRDRNVFGRMAEMFGPLQLLTRCVKEHLHVRVMTRGAALVRSICRGYIVAFDKHFNMALIDVDEIYRRPATLGKVRARRSHKLKAAQKVLKEESAEQAKQPLQLLAKENKPLIHGKESNKSAINEEIDLCTQQELTKQSSQSSSETPLQQLQPSKFVKMAAITANTNNPTGLKKKSVYEGSNEPELPFEREALMMGIADENVEYRHVNQLFIRGENIVLISIIND